MYSQAVQGNFGNTTQTSQPMYSNSLANGLGAATGLGTLGLGLYNSGLFSGLGGAAAGGMGDSLGGTLGSLIAFA
jgi:hypothetical protein